MQFSKFNTYKVVIFLLITYWLILLGSLVGGYLFGLPYLVVIFNLLSGSLSPVALPFVILNLLVSSLPVILFVVAVLRDNNLEIINPSITRYVLLFSTMITVPKLTNFLISIIIFNNSFEASIESISTISEFSTGLLIIIGVALLVLAYRFPRMSSELVNLRRVLFVLPVIILLVPYVLDPVFDQLITTTTGQGPTDPYQYLFVLFFFYIVVNTSIQILVILTLVYFLMKFSQILADIDAEDLDDLKFLYPEQS